MRWVYFEDGVELLVDDGDGPAPDVAEWAHLSGSIPAPRPAAFHDGDAPTPDMTEWADLFGGIPASESAAFFGLCRFCKANAAIVNAALPWLAAEVGHNDGYMLMLEFIRRWGGARLYVSKDHRRFVEKVGCALGAATHRRLLREASAASQVEVPSAWGVFMALRRAAIAIAIGARLPHDEVSRRFGVTMRSLR